MKVMNSKITVGNYVFNNRCSSVSIESTFKKLTSTCTLVLPNLKRMIDSKKLEKIIQQGDPVLVELGYNGFFKEEFRGYVSAIKPKQPLEIECEDAMWLAKQKTVTQSWASVKLKDVLKFLIPGVKLNCPDVTLSPFRLDKVTVAKALQKLSDEYMLVIYYRGDVLYAGLTYGETGLGSANFSLFGANANSDADNLEFMRLEDVKLKVHAISILPNNKKISVDIGDDEGNQTTLHFYNKTEAELKVIAKEALSKMKYDGYRGSLMGFGQPFVTHGMVANLTDERYPERAGSYFIDGVTTTYDISGFRRKIELGRASTNITGA